MLLKSGITAYYQYNGTFYSARTVSNGFANVSIPIGTSHKVTLNVNYTYVALLDAILSAESMASGIIDQNRSITTKIPMAAPRTAPWDFAI